MPRPFPYGINQEEDPEKAIYNPLFTAQLDTGGGDEYQKLLMSQLSAPPPSEIKNDEGDQAQLAAALGTAANAMGSVGGRTADSSGLQNWADLMTKRSMQKDEKSLAEQQKRQNLLAQFALLKDKQTGAGQQKIADQAFQKELAGFNAGNAMNLQKQKTADELKLASAKGAQEKAPKAPTADEKSYAVFSVSAKDATDLADKIESEGYDPSTYGASLRSTRIPIVGQLGATSEDKAYDQVKNTFISSVLRKESGASISDPEYQREERRYFPQPGDGPEIRAQKAAERKRKVASMIAAAGGAYDPSLQQPFDYQKPAARPDGLMAAEALANAPKVGDVVKGYSFKGGNPADKSSWEKVQ